MIASRMPELSDPDKWSQMVGQSYHHLNANGIRKAIQELDARMKAEARNHGWSWDLLKPLRTFDFGHTVEQEGCPPPSFGPEWQSARYLSVSCAQVRQAIKLDALRNGPLRVLNNEYPYLAYPWGNGGKAPQGNLGELLEIAKEADQRSLRLRLALVMS